MMKRQIEQLNRLKSRLTLEFGFAYGPCLGAGAVLNAVNDADAIAASSPFPLLIFPTLADEKVRKACQWQAKQRVIKRGVGAAR